MQQQASAIRAVIDIGSNTIEVLVARCLPGDLEIIEHQATMARLGESVNESGELSRDKFDTALHALRKYQGLAKKHGAEQILAVATEALREARNSQDFLEAVKRETDIEVQLISGSAEAVLDYLRPSHIRRDGGSTLLSYAVCASDTHPGTAACADRYRVERVVTPQACAACLQTGSTERPHDI